MWTCEMTRYIIIDLKMVIVLDKITIMVETSSYDFHLVHDPLSSMTSSCNSKVFLLTNTGGLIFCKYIFLVYIANSTTFVFRLTSYAYQATYI